VLRLSCTNVNYLYSPDGSLFEVEFPSKPFIENTKRATNPHNISEEVASLVLEEDSTVLTASFELYSFSFDSVPKDKLLDMLKKEAVLKGLVGAEVRYEPSALGVRYIIKGSKFTKIPNSNKEIELLHVYNWYFKKGNLFFVSVVCPVNLYPTKQITKFLGTLKLKDGVI
jgi:hypothetical protein